MKSHSDPKNSTSNKNSKNSKSFFHNKESNDYFFNKDNGGNENSFFSPTPFFSIKQIQRKENKNLPNEIQMNLEKGFGEDFSDVNIQENSEKADELNALAFTQGDNIHFAPGQFNPDSEKGRNLIGHEFTHVVQQRNGSVNPTNVLGKGLSLNENIGLENEADFMGEKAVKGEFISKYYPPSSYTNNDSNNILQAKCDCENDEEIVQRKPKETSIEDLLPPGDCTEDQHKSLQADVKEKCDNRPRGCKGTDTCSELSTKMTNNSNCIVSRQTINNTCFKGGDAGHIEAVEIAVNALIKCQSYFTSKCGEEVPENVPDNIPVPTPVPQSVWDKITDFVKEVVETGMDAELAAEKFLKDNPAIAWTIIILGVIGIIVLIADDLTIAGIADDFLIPIVGALVRVAWRYA